MNHLYLFTLSLSHKNEDEEGDESFSVGPRKIKKRSNIQILDDEEEENGKVNREEDVCIMDVTSSSLQHLEKIPLNKKSQSIKQEEKKESQSLLLPPLSSISSNDSSFLSLPPNTPKTDFTRPSSYGPSFIYIIEEK